jgi:hypothetical protein
MDEKLVNAVIKRVGKESLQDVVNIGANAGFPGFTYNWETIEFFKQYRDKIVPIIEDYSRELEISPIEFVASFRILQMDPKDPSDVGEIARALYGNLRNDDIFVPNALALFALEEVAHYVVEKEDENEE